MSILFIVSILFAPQIRANLGDIEELKNAFEMRNPIIFIENENFRLPKLIKYSKKIFRNSETFALSCDFYGNAILLFMTSIVVSMKQSLILVKYFNEGDIKVLTVSLYCS